LYSVDTTPTIVQWFNSISFACLQPANNSRAKCQAHHSETDDDSDEDVSSPDQKLSKKEHLLFEYNIENQLCYGQKL